MIRKDFVTPAEGEIGRDEPGTITLLNLGSDLNGFKNTTHGGVLCAILDEALAVCVEIHRQRLQLGKSNLYTACLVTNYRAPDLNPSTIAVKSRLDVVFWGLRE